MVQRTVSEIQNTVPYVSNWDYPGRDACGLLAGTHFLGIAYSLSFTSSNVSLVVLSTVANGYLIIHDSDYSIVLSSTALHMPALSVYISIFLCYDYSLLVHYDSLERESRARHAEAFIFR
jgi:hypothetical protein